MIAEGTPLELKDQSGAAALVVTVSHADDLDRGEALLRDLTCSEVHVDAGARRLTAPADGLGHMTRVAGVFDESGIVLDDIGLKRPSLDDVFLHLTGHRAEDVPPTTEPEQGPVPDHQESLTMTDARAPRDPPDRAAAAVLSIARRNLIHIKRMPEMLLDVTIQPVMFVLLFAFVFGASIDVDTPAGYRAWLLPGIMAQTVAFASFIVAVGLTADLEKGIVDRMRSLPINPAAVLVGRSISSLAHSSIGLVVMSLTGLVIGWRIHTSVPEAVLGYLLLLGWGFAMIWVGIWSARRCARSRRSTGVMFATMFPITFLANTFAPTDQMPTVLRFIAEWNPISSLTQAVRELWGNDQPRARGQPSPCTTRSPSRSAGSS